MLGWLLVGDGSPTVRVFPHQRCQTHCSSFNLWLEPGDLGKYTQVQFYSWFEFSLLTSKETCVYSVRRPTVLAAGIVLWPRRECCV